MSLIRAALLRLNSEGVSGGLPFQWHCPKFMCCYLDQGTICFASATCWSCMRAGGHYSLLANAWQIYGATAIKSVRVIARKTMTVEVAGLSGSGRWCETINLVCLPLYRTVAEFKGDCNFESTSNASNYSTASYKSISISISFPFPFPFLFPFPGFTTSPLECGTVLSPRRHDRNFPLSLWI